MKFKQKSSPKNNNVQKHANTLNGTDWNVNLSTNRSVTAEKSQTQTTQPSARYTHTECVSESERERASERANHIEGRKREKKEAKNWYIPRAREYKTLTANDQDDITIRRQIQRARFVIFYYVWTLFSFALSRSLSFTIFLFWAIFTSRSINTLSLARSLPRLLYPTWNSNFWTNEKCTILSKSNQNERKKKHRQRSNAPQPYIHWHTDIHDI